MIMMLMKIQRNCNAFKKENNNNKVYGKKASQKGIDNGYKNNPQGRRDRYEKSKSDQWGDADWRKKTM